VAEYLQEDRRVPARGRPEQPSQSGDTLSPHMNFGPADELAARRQGDVRTSLLADERYPRAVLDGNGRGGELGSSLALRARHLGPSG
jgi:hypothetical protein